MNATRHCLLSTLLLAAASDAAGATLAVQVGTGMQPGDHLMLAVYDREETWLGKSLRGVREALPATIGRRDWHSVRILDLPPGRYALAVYVDRNGNGKLDRGMFGIPSEPYGFSNGGGAFGPPEFAEAQVELGAADMTIRIDLN